MGKKRRLKCAKAKFALKHSAHPRAKFLASLDADPVDPEIVEEVEALEAASEEQKLPETPTLTSEEEPPAVLPPLPKKAPSKKTKTTKKAASRQTKKITTTQSL